MNEPEHIQNPSTPPTPPPAGGASDANDACRSCEEYKIGWKRALADYDNLQKDLVRERQSQREHIVRQVSDSFLSVLEHFDQAFAHKPTDLPSSASNWVAGVLHVRTELEGALREIGVEAFGAVGDVFDPNRHEAVSQRSDENAAPDTIVEVISRGFLIGSRVLRPARVIVSIT